MYNGCVAMNQSLVPRLGTRQALGWYISPRWGGGGADVGSLPDHHHRARGQLQAEGKDIGVEGGLTVGRA